MRFRVYLTIAGRRRRPFLADSTVALMKLCYSIVSVCTEYIVAKRCVLEQVTIDSLMEVVYERSIGVGTQINDYLCLAGRLRSCQSLCHNRDWIYRKPLQTSLWDIETSEKLFWFLRKLQLVLVYSLSVEILQERLFFGTKNLSVLGLFKLWIFHHTVAPSL